MKKNYNKLFFAACMVSCFFVDQSRAEGAKNKLSDILSEDVNKMKSHYQINSPDFSADSFADSLFYATDENVQRLKKKYFFDKKETLSMPINVHCLNASSVAQTQNRMLSDMASVDAPIDMVIDSYKKSESSLVGDLCFVDAKYDRQPLYFCRENYYVKIMGFFPDISNKNNDEILREDAFYKKIDHIPLARAIDRLIQFDLMRGRSRYFAMEDYAKQAKIKNPQKDQFKFDSRPFLLKQDILGVGKKGELVWDVRVRENSEKATLLFGAWVHFKTLKEAAWVQPVPKEDWLKMQEYINVDKGIDPAWLPSNPPETPSATKH